MNLLMNKTVYALYYQQNVLEEIHEPILMCRCEYFNDECDFSKRLTEIQDDFWIKDIKAYQGGLNRISL